jgi:hypothetical protein
MFFYQYFHYFQDTLHQILSVDGRGKGIVHACFVIRYFLKYLHYFLIIVFIFRLLIMGLLHNQ